MRTIAVDQTQMRTTALLSKPAKLSQGPIFSNAKVVTKYPFSAKTATSERMHLLTSDISKIESKLVKPIKCEKQVKKTLVIKKIRNCATKKIIKPKTQLMRCQSKPITNLIEADQQFNDITSVNSNVVISNIENFVQRKNR